MLSACGNLPDAAMIAMGDLAARALPAAAGGDDDGDAGIEGVDDEAGRRLLIIGPRRSAKARAMGCGVAT